MPDRVAQRLQDHIKESDSWKQEIKDDIKLIKNNHLAHMQESMQGLQVDVANVKNDVGWLKRFFWIVATASVGGLVTGVLNLIIE